MSTSNRGYCSLELGRIRLDSRTMMVCAANSSAWAIGRKQCNGFHVRRVVWGYTLAMYEKRADEEIRAATITVEKHFKRRRALACVNPVVNRHDP